MQVHKGVDKITIHMGPGECVIGTHVRSRDAARLDKAAEYMQGNTIIFKKETTKENEIKKKIFTSTMDKVQQGTKMFLNDRSSKLIFGLQLGINGLATTEAVMETGNRWTFQRTCFTDKIYHYFTLATWQITRNPQFFYFSMLAMYSG
ncbi:hypothetical protein IEQ34_004770 [Dendrobium chrysotoxum]|uniref:Uncharacterized protein n=1 Tax=Dendrobium chrysotoxum TaxID=161865 RepID=A0AAV7H6R7_DENCH|nr:hypothetical protein IEQ34_004770 [Dendrobium chrysotoxum]